MSYPSNWRPPSRMPPAPRPAVAVAPSQPPQSIPQAELQAALDREVSLMLMQAALGNAGLFDQAAHGARALSAVRDGVWAWSAKRTYHVPPMLKGAWAALPVGIENMTMAQVQELLAAHGVEIAADDVTDLQVDAGQQLEDAQGAVVVAHQEQAAARVHGHHGGSDVVLSHGGAL